jgi:hypothetical protein
MENEPKTKETPAQPPPELEVGSRWRRGPHEISLGYKEGTVRVMAIAEGYVMVRFPGLGAWVRHWREFVKEFELATPAPSVECEPGAGLPPGLVNKAAYAVLKDQGVDLTLDPSAFYPVEAQMRVALRTVGLAQMVDVLMRAVSWGENPAVRRGELNEMFLGWLAEFKAALAPIAEVERDEPKNAKAD